MLLYRIGVEFAEGIESRVGYLANVKPTTHTDHNNNENAALIFYFIKDDGSWFKAIQVLEPYFYVQCDEEVIK